MAENEKDHGLAEEQARHDADCNNCQGENCPACS